MNKSYAIAVDLGATNVRVALVSQTGEIVRRAAEKTAKKGTDGIVVTEQIIQLIRNIAQDIPPKKIRGIGISSIGPLDYEKGGPFHSPNVPYPFIPLRDPLKEAFSLPLHLFNDANAAALGEKYFGAGREVKNLVYITMSTGIGGGAVVDGNLLLGRGGNAAEIGHMIVDTTYNLLCTCKKGVGHWESLASGTNIPRFFRAWAQRNEAEAPESLSSAKEVFELARNNDQPARAFLDELAKVNARASSNLIVSYDPELITLGGAVALHNEQFIVPGIKKYVDHYLEMPDIKVTQLGEDIGLLGTAAMVFQKQ